MNEFFVCSCRLHTTDDMHPRDPRKSHEYFYLPRLSEPRLSEPRGSCPLILADQLSLFQPGGWSVADFAHYITTRSFRFSDLSTVHLINMRSNGFLEEEEIKTLLK